MLSWIFRGLAIAAAVAVFAALAFVIGMRFTAPTPAEAAALRRLQEPNPPVRGRDGSDAAWLLDYEVPPERLAELGTKVRRYEAETAAAVSAGRQASTRRDPRKELQRFPEQPGDWQGVCAPREPGCLAYVEENRSLVAATLDAHAGRLAAALAFSDHDGLRTLPPHTLRAEFAQLGGARRLVLAHFALRFAGGERLGAVEAVCRDIAGWRRLGGDSDQLVYSMVGVGFVRQDLPLLADMLAKLPKDTELPGECNAALQESADYELDLCPAIRSEFALARGVPAELAVEARSELPSWAWDDQNFLRLRALDLVRYCGPVPLRGARADRRAATYLPPPPSCTRARRWADPVGCELAGLAAADFSDYLDRRTDQAAMLALMRTIVWLRDAAADKESVAAALAQRPRELGLRREPAYDFENDRLSMPMLDDARGPHFELAAGAQPRPTRRRRICCTRRSSRNLASQLGSEAVFSYTQ